MYIYMMEGSLQNKIITETSDFSPKNISISESIKDVYSPEAVSPPKETKFEFWKIGLIILVVAFLGFNLFTHLGEATDKTTGILGPILTSISTFFGDFIKQVTNITALGTKTGVDVGAGTVSSGVDLLQGNIEEKNDQDTRNQIDNNVEPQQQLPSPPVATPPSAQTPLDSLDKALSHALDGNNAVPEPDDAGSRTQSSSSNSKSGYCYIGEDRGFRSCVKVTESDTCMSGDIFPSNEICVNPSLRE
jgi:hypothetical protein